MDQFDEIYESISDSGVDLPPWPKVELTLEQEFRVAAIERELPSISKETIADLLISYVKMNLLLQNNLSQVFKWAQDNGKKGQSI
jgi:hypothetical protein